MSGVVSRWLAPAVLGLYCTFANAHDFWLQPNEYWLQPGVETPLTVQVGHGTSRQRSPIPMRRVIRFEAFEPEGTTKDLRSALHLGEPDSDATLRFETPGAHVLVLETDNRARSYLPAGRFNAYLREEGLTAALAYREATQQMQTSGAENYRRVAKSIVQVGAVQSATQALVTRPLGLLLEIVPERSPYAEPCEASLPVRVLYENQPLAGAMVKLTHVEHDDSTFETRITDAAGGARFSLPRFDSWRLNVVWTKPPPTSSDVNFETVFSSLSFGFVGSTASDDCPFR